VLVPWLANDGISNRHRALQQRVAHLWWFEVNLTRAPRRKSPAPRHIDISYLVIRVPEQGERVSLRDHFIQNSSRRSLRQSGGRARSWDLTGPSSMLHTSTIRERTSKIEFEAID
jgi:hypothetical protein